MPPAHTPHDAAELPPLEAPQSKTDLFVSFTWLALQGFGGVLAVVQRELVEKKRWMTREQFVEDWAVAQIMPGPNVVNLAMMIGGRYFGLPGALAALAGMLSAPMVLVLSVVAVFPVLYSFWISLHDLKLTRPHRVPFVWFDNYVKLFTDPLFWESVGRTASFTVMSVLPGAA